MKSRILIIDDDEKLTRLLSRFLMDFGFEVKCAHAPSQGFKLLTKFKPDLIVLDIMLPEMDGFEVCRTLRKSSDIPIIMLTARGELTDKVVGLEMGSDDYLAKPFEPRELVARIHTILRRVNKETKRTSNFSDLTIDQNRRTATYRDADLELTTNEFAVLVLLSSQPGKVFNRDEILQELRGIDCDAFNRTVDITVSRLRQKLGDNPKQPDFIKTVWGSGYVFIGKEDETI